MKKEKISLEKKTRSSAKVSPDTASTVTETNPDTIEITTESPVKSKAASRPVVTRVGDLLKEMRQRKNLKLTDIAKKLCIRRFYLEAIEESNYKDIPEFPYGIGFIRSYADFLGLNGSNIVELYKEETETRPDKDIFMLEPQSEATVPGKKYLLISLLALILVYLAWYFYNNQTLPVIEEPETLPTVNMAGDNAASVPLVVEEFSVAADVAETPAEAVAVIDTTLEPVNPGNQIVVTNETFPATAPVIPTVAPVEVVMQEPTAEVEPKTEPVANIPAQGVYIKITGETWIEVKDESRLYLSKVLNAGDTYTLPEGGRGIILSIGRPSAAEVYINGKLTTVATMAKKTNIAMNKYLDAANR